MPPLPPESDKKPSHALTNHLKGIHDNDLQTRRKLAANLRRVIHHNKRPLNYNLLEAILKMPQPHLIGFSNFAARILKEDSDFVDWHLAIHIPIDQRDRLFSITIGLVKIFNSSKKLAFTAALTAAKNKASVLLLQRRLRNPEAVTQLKFLQERIVSPNFFSPNEEETAHFPLDVTSLIFLTDEELNNLQSFINNITILVGDQPIPINNTQIDDGRIVLSATQLPVSEHQEVAALTHALMMQGIQIYDAIAASIAIDHTSRAHCADFIIALTKHIPFSVELAVLASNVCQNDQAKLLQTVNTHNIKDINALQAFMNQETGWHASLRD